MDTLADLARSTARSRFDLPLLLATLFLLVPLTAQRPLEVTGLAEKDVLSVAATFTDEQLCLRLHVAPGWHLYGRDVGGGQPVKVEILEGSCFEAAGALQVPMDASGQITGDAQLALPLRRTAEGGALKARLRFMACDALMCQPPREALLEATGSGGGKEALSVLLVTVEKAERSGRIATWLKERGFRCTVTPYAEVTGEACDAHDLVLADSPYFDQAGGGRRYALKFPETKTPIVAVGYLGTVLLEAQRIAMTCGYI